MRAYEQRARDLDALLAPAELERDNQFIERLMLEHDACIGAEESKRAWVRENFRATLEHAIRELQMERDALRVALLSVLLAQDLTEAKRLAALPLDVPRVKEQL